jgi:hypothetical protein
MKVTQIILETAQEHYIPLFLFLLVAHFALNRYGNALRAIPGPFFASLTDFWRLFHSRFGQGHQDYLLHRKYNTQVLRTGPKTIAVADPDAIRVIYGWKPVFRKVGRLSSRSYLTTSC